MATQAFVETRQLVGKLEYRNMSDLLLDFRRYIEKDAGAPVQRVETNAALVLHDLCRFLKLGEQQREKVLGKSAAAFVDGVLDERVTLPTS